jgi:hypothetical protein
MDPRRLRPSRSIVVGALLASVLAGVRCSSGIDAGPCGPGDSDGLSGGHWTFDLTASDTSFTPAILKAQNLSSITLTLTNAGSKPHDFVIDCLPTPNANGCPAASCFDDASVIGPIAPEASVTATFDTARVDGIYRFRSDLPGDTQTGDGGMTGLVGQFIVQ